MARVYLCEWETYTASDGEPSRRPVTPSDAKWAASDLGTHALVVTPDDTLWPVDLRRVGLGDPSARVSQGARERLRELSVRGRAFPANEVLGDTMLRVLKRAGAIPGQDGRLRAHYNGVEIHSARDVDVNEPRGAAIPVWWMGE